MLKEIRESRGKKNNARKRGLSDMEYKTIIHNAKEELPVKSGDYLVKTSDQFNLWQVLPYSIKFKKFNSYDSQDNDRRSINGSMWAELPKGEETDEY